jgi:hypothetical protein
MHGMWDVDAWNVLVVFGTIFFPKNETHQTFKKHILFILQSNCMNQVSSGAPKGELQFTFGPSKSNVAIKMYDPRPLGH